MVYSTLVAAAASFLLASTVTLVHAGSEMDVPGLGMLNRAAPLNPWKRGNSKTFGLVTNYQGSSFLDGWSAFSWADPTNGQVNVGALARVADCLRATGLICPFLQLTQYNDMGSLWNKGLVYPTDAGTL